MPRWGVLAAEREGEATAAAAVAVEVGEPMGHCCAEPVLEWLLPVACDECAKEGLAMRFLPPLCGEGTSEPTDKY